MDPFLQAVIDEARRGKEVGDILTGSVLVHAGTFRGEDELHRS